jgi:hypothetical protein
LFFGDDKQLQRYDLVSTRPLGESEDCESRINNLLESAPSARVMILESRVEPELGSLPAWVLGDSCIPGGLPMHCRVVSARRYTRPQDISTDFTTAPPQAYGVPVFRVKDRLKEYGNTPTESAESIFQTLTAQAELINHRGETLAPLPLWRWLGSIAAILVLFAVVRLVLRQRRGSERAS